MPTRYRFFDIFGINPESQDIYPLYNMVVNGQFFRQYYTIPRGLSFGGIDIYTLVPRDFAGTWNGASQTLTLTSIY